MLCESKDETIIFYSEQHVLRPNIHKTKEHYFGPRGVFFSARTNCGQETLILRYKLSC